MPTRRERVAAPMANGVALGAAGPRRVGEIQRARIVGAMGELVRERGPGAVTVARVVARSGVSRRTFYELFQDREDCFLGAFDAAIARAAESVAPAYRAPGPWRERVRAGLQATLCFLDDEPQLGYLCVVGSLGGGEQALERRARVVAKLVDAVHEGRQESRAATRPDRLAAEGVVGAVLSVIHARLVERAARHEDPHGRAPKPLLSLLNPLMGMLVLPYLGAAAAERERRRPAPRAQRAAAPRSNPLGELDMRLTYRTVRVLTALSELSGEEPANGTHGPSNRQVAAAAGISDQGQISRLLARLRALGLVGNDRTGQARGEPNAWTLTPRGREVARTLRPQSRG